MQNEVDSPDTCCGGFIATGIVAVVLRVTENALGDIRVVTGLATPTLLVGVTSAYNTTCTSVVIIGSSVYIEYTE